MYILQKERLQNLFYRCTLSGKGLLNIEICTCIFSNNKVDYLKWIGAEKTIILIKKYKCVLKGWKKIKYTC